MNVTSSLSLVVENCSEKTSGWWNSTGTTTASSTSASVFGPDLLDVVTAGIQWVVFVVGIVGNLTVLVVLVWRRSRSQVGTQLFVGSLAISDLGMMLTTTWVEANDSLIKIWYFGLVACKIHKVGQWTTMHNSIWTLATLSLDRYLFTLNYFQHLIYCATVLKMQYGCCRPFIRILGQT